MLIVTKERSIIFNTEMVRAILDGRKTQTRKMLTGKQLNMFKCAASIGECHYLDGEINSNSMSYYIQYCPFGQVGDQLYVRETWCLSINEDGHPINKDGELSENKHAEIFYRATPVKNTEAKWCPSRYMPRWAARIILEVTDVRVERLNDISEQDAINEGCDYQEIPGMGWKFKAAFNFKFLWKKTYGEQSLKSNPWVWVIEFKVINVKV